MDTLVKERKATRKLGKLAPKLKTLKEYYRLESRNESDYNLEFNNGTIEKKRKMLTRKQFYIYRNILADFKKSRLNEEKYELWPEMEFIVSADKIRIPDITLLSEKQALDIANGIEVVPDMLIEVVSEHDSLKHLEYKLMEYFSAGVKCVWAVIPDIELVYVYSSARQVIIYSEKQMCTAKPAIDFEIVTEDIFRR